MQVSYFFVLLLFFIILKDSHEISLDNKNYNLLLADQSFSTIEEYRGDDFTLLRKYENSKLNRITDVVVKDGHIYVSAQTSRGIFVYNETSLEYITTLLSYDGTYNSPLKLRWIQENGETKLLVVVSSEDENTPDKITVLNITNATSVTSQYDLVADISVSILDVTQRTDTEELLVLTDNNQTELWTLSSGFQGVIINGSKFGNDVPTALAWSNGYLYVAASSFIYRFFPNGSTFDLDFRSVDLTMNIAVMLFPSDYDHSVYCIGQIFVEGGYDGIAKNYSMDTNTSVLLFDPEAPGNYLGDPWGATWNSDGDMLLADNAKVQHYSSIGEFIRELSDHGGYINPKALFVDPNSPMSIYVTSSNAIMIMDRLTFEYNSTLVPSIFPNEDGCACSGHMLIDDNIIYQPGYDGTIIYAINGSKIDELAISGTSIAKHPVTGLYYIGDGWSGELYVYDPLTGDIETKSGWCAGYPCFVTISPDGDTVYTADYYYIYRVKLATGIVSVFDVSDAVQYILDLTVGPDGNIYVYSPSGIALFGHDVEFKELITGPFKEGVSTPSAISFVPAVCQNCSAGEICVYGSCEVPTSQEDNSIVKVVIGAVIGAGIIVGAAVGVGVFLYRRKHRNLDGGLVSAPSEEELLSPASTNSPQIIGQQQAVNQFDAHWEIKFNEISLGEPVDAGAFGTIYKGIWRNCDCVVKRLQEEHSSEEDKKNFLKEADTVKHLRPHKNVCAIFGVCTDPKYPTCIVMEFVNGGSLQKLIQKNKIELNDWNILKMAKDITSGMSHLHMEGLLHCDLACRNLLVSFERDNEFTIKISDFGLATREENAKPNKVFPVKWSAPEILLGGKPSKAADVWSFGVVMWEILAGTHPYPDMLNQQVVEYVTIHKGTLGAPTKIHYPPELFGIVQTCWNFNPQERPSFDELFIQFKELQQKIYEEFSSGHGMDEVKLEEPVYSSLKDSLIAPRSEVHPYQATAYGRQESTMVIPALYGNQM